MVLFKIYKMTNFLCEDDIFEGFFHTNEFFIWYKSLMSP